MTREHEPWFTAQGNVLFQIEHTATFLQNEGGVPLLKLSDLRRIFQSYGVSLDAASRLVKDLRDDDLIQLDSQGRVTLTDEARGAFAGELAERRRLYEQHCRETRVRAETTFCSLFRAATTQAEDSQAKPQP